MPVLKNHNGANLKDAAGNEIKVGQTVTDTMFGDGIVEGTVPIDKGEGVNVMIDWLGPNVSGKPESRSCENLTVKFATGGAGTRVRAHTGQDFESGAVFEARGRNDADAARLNEANGEAMGEAAGAQSAGRLPAAASVGPAAGFQSPQAANPTPPQECDSSHEPWLGKADKLDAIGKLIISHYEQRIVNIRELHGGEVVLTPRIKYRTKHEPVDKERIMTANGFNQSRLGDYLLSNEFTPEAVREVVARKMRSKKAKQIIAEIEAKRKAGDSMLGELQACAHM